MAPSSTSTFAVIHHRTKMDSSSSFVLLCLALLLFANSCQLVTSSSSSSDLDQSSEQQRDNNNKPKDGNNNNNSENWKKWSPPQSELYEGKSFGTNNNDNDDGYHQTESSQQQQQELGSSVNCSHYSSSCHECTRHRRECSFLLCERRSMCINVNDPRSVQQAHTTLHEIIARCHFVDQCSSFGKRNIQQLAAFSQYLSSSGLPNPGPNVMMARFRSQHNRVRPGNFVLDPHFNQKLDLSSSSSNKPSKSEEEESPAAALMKNFFMQRKSNSGTVYVGLNEKNGTSQVRRSLGSGGGTVTNRRFTNNLALRRRIKAEKEAAEEAERKRRTLLHIGLGTVIALIVCSSLVLSAVITVAYKKIRKIYAHNRSMAYGTLEEDR